MAEIKWIKIATGIFDDEKIKLIESMPDGDAMIVIWFKLLCLAGVQNNGGYLIINDRIAYTDEMLATIFRRNINTVRLALTTFESFGMVEIVEGVITIPNWNKHQTLIEKKEYDRIAKQKQREREKLNSVNNVNDVSMIVKGKNKEQKNKEERMNVHCTTADVPSLDEVVSFAKANNLVMETVDRFLYHYNMNGWKVNSGKPVSNWKGLLISWCKATAEIDPLIMREVNAMREVTE